MVYPFNLISKKFLRTIKLLKGTKKVQLLFGVLWINCAILIGPDFDQRKAAFSMVKSVASTDK